MTTIEQRHAALQIANTVRSRNHQTKAQVAILPFPDGCRTVADMLDQRGTSAETVQVGQLLTAIRLIGPDIASRLLARTGVWRHSRLVRDLTGRQRTVLAGLLREKAQTYKPHPRKVAA